MTGRHQVIGTYETITKTNGSKGKTKIFRCIGEIIFEAAKRQAKRKEHKISMLVAIPSPRDIPEFKSAVDESLQAYDKVWFKYFPQSANPYLMIKDYFLKRPRYEYLAILPDDLIINKHGVNKLIDNVLSDPKKYRVMSGVCNCEDNEWGNKLLAFTNNLPTLKKFGRTYQWQSSTKMLYTGIHAVPHNGTPFTIISKDVVRLVSFDNDAKWNLPDLRGISITKYDADLVYRMAVGCCEDVVLSNDLARLGIQNWVDTDVFFFHLKGKKGVPS